MSTLRRLVYKKLYILLDDQDRIITGKCWSHGAYAHLEADDVRPPKYHVKELEYLELPNDG